MKDSLLELEVTLPVSHTQSLALAACCLPDKQVSKVRLSLNAQPGSLSLSVQLEWSSQSRDHV